MAPVPVPIAAPAAPLEARNDTALVPDAPAAVLEDGDIAAGGAPLAAVPVAEHDVPLAARDIGGAALVPVATPATALGAGESAAGSTGTGAAPVFVAPLAVRDIAADASLTACDLTAAELVSVAAPLAARGIAAVGTGGPGALPAVVARAIPSTPLALRDIATAGPGAASGVAPVAAVPVASLAAVKIAARWRHRRRADPRRHSRRPLRV